MNWKAILFVFFLLVPAMSTSLIGPATIKAEGINATIEIRTFQISFEQIEVTSNSIEIAKLSYKNPISPFTFTWNNTFNWTKENTTISNEDFPFSSGPTIFSNINYSVTNQTAQFNVTNCTIETIDYFSAQGSFNATNTSFNCIQSNVTIDNLTIEQGENTINIFWGIFEDLGGYTILSIVFALLILLL